MVFVCWFWSIKANIIVRIVSSQSFRSLPDINVFVKKRKNFGMMKSILKYKIKLDFEILLENYVHKHYVVTHMLSWFRHLHTQIKLIRKCNFIRNNSSTQYYNIYQMLHFISFLDIHYLSKQFFFEFPLQNSEAWTCFYRRKFNENGLIQIEILNDYTEAWECRHHISANK